MEQWPSALFPNSKEASWAAANDSEIPAVSGLPTILSLSLGVTAAGQLSHPVSVAPLFLLLLLPSVLGGMYSGHKDRPPVGSPTSVHPLCSHHALLLSSTLSTLFPVFMAQGKEIGRAHV